MSLDSKFTVEESVMKKPPPSVAVLKEMMQDDAVTLDRATCKPPPDESEYAVAEFFVIVLETNVKVALETKIPPPTSGAVFSSTVHQLKVTKACSET